MDLRELMKEWRIWILLLFLGIATVGLGPHYDQRDGDVVLDTSLNKGLDLQGGTRVLLKVKTNNTTRATADQVRGIIETRVSAFGLTQTQVRTVKLGDDFKVQVEVADTNQTKLQRLIAREGSFEARMPFTVKNSRTFNLTEPHQFVKDGSTVKVDGSSKEPGDVFYLEGGEENGTKFVYVNSSEQQSRFEVVMYDGTDIQAVKRSESLVQQSRSGFSFRFPVVITTEAAENVRRISRNYGSTFAGNSAYLSEDGQPVRMGLYVDNERTTGLQVASSFKRDIVTSPSISGGAPSAEEARTEMKRLQSILESGRLPYPVEVESISTVSSSLGQQFTSAAFISIIGALIAVGLLIFVRYGNLKLAVPIVLTGSSEVFILVGTWFSTIATLDLASIAGIIAAVGTGVDDQIIITDESGREKIRSWSKRMKRAFFVIFTSAASTIGAMTPLVSPEISVLAVTAAGLGLIGYTFYSRNTNPHYIVIGAIALTVGLVGRTMNPSGFALQAVQGFAITTILGVMVGIAITRPAYAKVLEQMEN